MADDYKNTKLEPWERNKKGGHIWWTSPEGAIGEFLFSFDKKKIYNLFQDYPNELTPEEKALFDKEEGYWADFFKDRKYSPKTKAEVPKGVTNVARELNFKGIESVGEWNGYQVFKEIGGKATYYILYDPKSERTKTSTSEETKKINQIYRSKE